MEITFRPLSKRHQAELQGHVAWSITLFRAFLFLAVVGALGWFLRAVHARATEPGSFLGSDAWWAVPLFAFAVGLYVVSSRWTGGRGFRRAVRADLNGGMARVRRITTIDAIEVAEQEDEGHSYFLLTDDGRTMLFAGQYLDRYRRRGFPWRAFDIIEAPASERFLDLVRAGDRLVPSVRRPPFTWAEVKRFGVLERYRVVDDVDFDLLKRSAPESPQ
jgi:hypothetical protein